MRGFRELTAGLLALLLTVMPAWSWTETASTPEEEKTETAPLMREAGQKPTLEKSEGEGKGEAKEGECPATFGPLITDTAVPLDKGKFAVQPTFSLSFITHNFNRKWGRVSAGGDFKSFGMDWKFTYGLINNLEVFVVIPYIHNWAANVEEPGPNGERAANYGGLGDINLTLKYRLVEETETRPTITALFSTTFPSGRFRGLNPANLGCDVLGGGAYVFTAGLNLSKYLKPFIFYGNLWYSVGTDFKDDEGRKFPRDFVTVNLAAEYPLTPKWVLLLELTTYWDGGRLFGPKSNVAPSARVSLLPGIEFMATEKFSLALGVNIDLVGKNTEAAITPMLSMVYCF
jgi:hypothetical protein